MLQKTITELEGVYASGIHIGIKPNKKDMAFIYVPDAFSSAGVFTTNRFAAPSVIRNRKCLKRNIIKAVCITSGNANAATGERGVKDNKKKAELVAKALNLRVLEVAVCATGIIGVPIPIETVKKGITELLKDPYVKNGLAAAEAILTTDTSVKISFKEKKIGKKTIVVAGFTKGSGMIAPNLATTLTFLVTNAAIPKEMLDGFLKNAIEDTYNMISVDTDTSTSDSVLIISTGQAKISLNSKDDVISYKSLLNDTCLDLAKQIIRDGEGAGKLIEVKVEGAASRGDARIIAKSIIDSPLVKCAVYGEDPNWGRVLMAAGKPKTKLNPEKVDLFFGEQLIFSNGLVLNYNTGNVINELKKDTVNIRLNLNLNKYSATAWGCDLTEEYVRLNTKYS